MWATPPTWHDTFWRHCSISAGDKYKMMLVKNSLISLKNTGHFSLETAPRNGNYRVNVLWFRLRQFRLNLLDSKRAIAVIRPECLWIVIKCLVFAFHSGLRRRCLLIWLMDFHSVWHSNGHYIRMAEWDSFRDGLFGSPFGINRKLFRFLVFGKKFNEGFCAKRAPHPPSHSIADDFLMNVSNVNQMMWSERTLRDDCAVSNPIEATLLFLANVIHDKSNYQTRIYN